MKDKMDYFEQLIFIDIIFLISSIILFCSVSLFYINRIFNSIITERYINYFIHILIVPFSIILLYKFFLEFVFFWVFEIFIVVIFLVYDFIIKNFSRISKSKYEQLIRITYYIIYVIMQIVILYRIWVFSVGWFIFLFLFFNFNTIIFIIYLKKYEKILYMN